jgi:hypothetical protein
MYSLLFFISVPLGPWVNQQKAMNFILHIFLYLQLKFNVYQHLEDDNL